MQARKLDDKLADFVKEQNDKGVTRSTLARLLNVHSATVTDYMHRHGITPKYTNYNRKRTEIPMLEAATLYLDGWSTHKLGRRYRVSSETVRRKLIGFGVEIRSNKQ